MNYILTTDDVITRSPYVDVRAYASLNEAVAVSSGKTILIATPQTLTASLTVPADIALRVIKGGAIVKDSTYTLTINGSFEAGAYQVFSGFNPGDVTFGAGSVKEVLPQWWGAKGDGSNDDRIPLQASIDSLSSGGVVYVTAGTYMLKSFSSSYYTVKPKSNVSVRGAGPATIFKFGNNLRTSTQGLSFLYDNDNPIANIIYSDFTVDWNGQNNLISSSNTATENINRMGGCCGVTNVHFRNIHFKNSGGGHHINVSNETNEPNPTNPNSRVTVIGCIFEDAGRAISGNDYVTDHTSVFMDVPHSIVANNVFLMSNTNDTVATAMETHDSDILLEGNAVYNYAKGVNLGAEKQSANGVIVQGNTFDSVITGISLWNASTYIASDWTIANNDIRLREATGINSVGIEAQTTQMAGSNSGTRLKIIGNRLRMLTQNNLTGYNDAAISLYRWESVNIENNEIVNFVQEAIFIQAETGARRVAQVGIRGNMMRGCGITGTTANKRFIVLNAGTTPGTDDITNVDISGNQLIATAGAGTVANYGIQTNTGRLPLVYILNNQFSGFATSDLDIQDANASDVIMINGYYSTAAPSAGNWHVGAIVTNSVPAVGQPKGWCCTVSGAPGTWVSEGNL